MATGGGLALPEPLDGDDAKSWFKRYEVCAIANGWNDQKKLLRLPTLLKGRSWAVYDSLSDANIVMSSGQQQQHYRSSNFPQLKKGQKVLLSNATRGKLDPRWTGPWVVQKYHGSTTVRIKKGKREQVVHTNRIRPFLKEDVDTQQSSTWSPPLFQNDSPDAHEPAQQDDQLPRSRSGRTIRPVDYFRY